MNRFILFLTLCLLGLFLIFFFLPHKSTFTSIISPLISFNIPSPSPTPVSWSLLLTGDVIPARVVNQKMVAKHDFLWPIRNIAPILRDADLTLINLESPLIENCPITNEGFKFCGEAEFAKSLQDSGVDVANLANNHSLNYGWEGLAETEKHLSAVGIATTGFTSQGHSLQARKECPLSCSKLSTKIIQLKPRHAELVSASQNIIVGFLGYNAVGQSVDRNVAQQEIQSAKQQVDLLIVSVHWGKEYTHTPETDANLAPDDPKELGRLFIDWGADIVVGNHPHWIQPVEWISNRPIFYALGNTVFDQEWSEETKRGMLVKLYFNDTEILKDKLEIIPIGIRNYGEAYVLEENEKKQILEEFNR